MNVLEIAVQADAEGAEAVAAAFNEYAYGGAVIEQTLEPEPGQQLDLARPFTVRAFLLCDASASEKRQALEEAAWHLSQVRPLGPMVVRELQEEDWANAWKRFYTVLHIGKRTVVKPSWLDYSPEPGEIVIELDPGMAFGTGLHPTTRLCLVALEDYATPGMAMLDVGTGSGILSIAAAKLGAGRVQACDIDPIAVEATEKNVELNHVSHIVSVTEGSVSTAQRCANADVIMGNLLAEIVAELAPALSHHLARSGVLIASGILVQKAGLVESALRDAGLAVVETRPEEDWLVMLARRGSG